MTDDQTFPATVIAPRVRGADTKKVLMRQVGMFTADQIVQYHAASKIEVAASVLAAVNSIKEPDHKDAPKPQPDTTTEDALKPQPAPRPRRRVASDG